MSAFSEAFSRLIKEKDIQVYSLVKYCNTDRSTMYKIINGKRNPPSISTFNKIANFMHLTPLEYQEFKTAYEITIMGKENFYQRKNVEDFILNFPSGQHLSTAASIESPKRKYTDPNPSEKSMVFLGHAKFNQILHHILMKENNKKIALLLQPDYELLFELLSNLKSGITSSSVQIEHTFCLSKTKQLSEDNKHYNLTYLRNILSLYISDLDYHPYYFYDDITSHFYNHNAFPYMVLTSEYALLCTSDYKTGILHRDTEIVKTLWRLYYSYQDKCTSLFHIVESVLEECLALSNISWAQTSNYVIQPEPCLTPFITPQLLDSALTSHIPNRENLMPILQGYIKQSNLRITNKNMHIYHTKGGIERFAQTGRLSEIPSEIYRPLNINERILLLQQLLAACRKCNYRLLKKPLEFIPYNFHLCVNETTGYLLFSNIFEKQIYLIFHEPDLLTAFLDYASWLDETNYLATEEESREFISTIINNLTKLSSAR